MQTENPCAKIYTIKDFEKLNKHAEAHILSDKTIEVINMLANMVGAPSYSRTPNFTSDNRRRIPGHNKHRRRDKKNTEISDEDWEAIRNFKATQYSKAEGLNESLNAIRIEINKITNNTYTTQMELINNKLSELMETGAIGADDKSRIAELIFIVASSNKFYSSLYANIIIELTTKFDWLTELFNGIIESKFTEYAVFENADPDADYDQFCNINKINENRQSLMCFYIELLKNGFIDLAKIYQYTNHYRTLFNEQLDTDNVAIVEQIGENISILIEGSYEFYDNHELSNNMEEEIAYIRNITETSASKHHGLSNKTIFKFLDTLDNI
tara:strand:- start:1472 stop:2452 length:981 start_codon:yes stop_codon:yes gene_type:complete